MVFLMVLLLLVSPGATRAAIVSVLTLIARTLPAARAVALHPAHSRYSTGEPAPCWIQPRITACSPDVSEPPGGI